MPGKVNRKYIGENIRISKSVTQQLHHIMPTLQPGYTAQNILQAYKSYYPYEWNEIVERQRQYEEKDKFLRKVGKKERYKPLPPEQFFYSLQKVKHVLSRGYREKHSNDYSEEKRLEYELQLRKKRDAAIEKRRAKINTHTKGIQKVDPGFIDALIYAYHRKGNTTNDKLEILREISKYECKKTDEFLWKLNDSEKNNEIRRLAFKHLQETGHYVKLRKSFNGKKKHYMTEKSDLVGTPEALAERLSKSKSFQNMKQYALFVSHSYQDKKVVEEIVKNANQAGWNCYVDWTADDDFLKRSMVSEFTKEVLKTRMRQSRSLLFLSSEKSRASEWVSFELNYYESAVKRPIYMILLDGEDKHDFEVIKGEELTHLQIFEKKKE